MPDPIYDSAQYVIIPRRGHTRLFLVQQGRLQDPGMVTAIPSPPSSGARAVARWLTRAVMAWLSGMGGGGAVAPHHLTARANEGPVANLDEPAAPQRSRASPDRTRSAEERLAEARAFAAARRALRGDSDAPHRQARNWFGAVLLSVAGRLRSVPMSRASRNRFTPLNRDV
jgi:hypothetical protein